MRWRWDLVYPPWGLPNMYSQSLSQPPLPLYPRTPAVSHWRCSQMPWSSEVRDALGGRDRVSSEMHWEARIEWTRRYTPRLWSSKFGDALGGRDRVNSEIHLEAVIERVWRCTGRPWLREVGDALWGHNRARLEMQLETEIEWTQRCTWSPWLSKIGDALAGYDRAWLEKYLEAVNLEGGTTAAETLAGSGRLSILGWCCTWCMLYSVLSHDHGMER